MNIRSAHFLPGNQKQLGNKYLLLECLGDGSHGWVWRAERLLDGEIVAVKIPKDITKEDRELVEGKELLGLDPHPNIIKIYDMGRIEKEWFYIEMEYFPSQTLAQKMDVIGSKFGQSYERVFKIYRQILNAVHYLAELEIPISHGDIKPHNILIGDNDLVKLTDFGSSALPEEIYVRTRENGGTVLYSAPEFSYVVSRKGSAQDLLLGDIYSLGVLLYQLLTGQLPHNTPAAVYRHTNFPKPSELNISINEKLDLFVLKCLQKNPEERFQNMVDLKNAFEKAVKFQTLNSAQTLIRQYDPIADWSTKIVNLLSERKYLKAAYLSKQVFDSDQDILAFHHYLIALYKDQRFLELSEAVRANQDIILNNTLNDDLELLELIAKVSLLQRDILFANKWIDHIKIKYTVDSPEYMKLKAVALGLDARYSEARDLLECLNEREPRQIKIVKQLIQVCEQLRDYSSVIGYLKLALRLRPNDSSLLEKKDFYQRLSFM
ncbi:protein kinase [Acinetobacter lactucae]|uniref:serine/threonine-protein kinase n=1 Tax=Acinetobacter lactucae TaxID=1785128 RepID=UPI0007A0A0CC|nr:serine/threonine-protein kinase [Acinetobacter lactucae]KYQ80671.1 protein kinase [Acinetobacter lactucae]